VVDALLAATAGVHGLVLVTRNAADVEGLGVRVLDPFAAARADRGGTRHPRAAAAGDALAVARTGRGEARSIIPARCVDRAERELCWSRA
jgi:hypothetical protein